MSSKITQDIQQKESKSTSRLRVQLDFSRDAFDRLEELGEETDADSKAEVIRNALRAYEWIVEQCKKDRFIEVQDSDGKLVSRVEAKWLLR